ncbi:ciliary-associated calcium-binding coiled-coil protein 1 isoform X2 [Heterodontus francisci]|uniref:ciliary-associated calcium-binding coiled-coil protein 1 isoform X2 n=1 Tax=Heterodontus francisci TaxID=7792 RepID=UPI00355BC8B4
MSGQRYRSRTTRSQVDSPSIHSNESNSTTSKPSEKVLAEIQADENVDVKERENPLAWKFISFSQLSDLVQLTVDGVQKDAAVATLYFFSKVQGQNVWASPRSGMENIGRNSTAQAVPVLHERRCPLGLLCLWIFVGARAELYNAANICLHDSIKYHIGEHQCLFQHYKLYEFLFHHAPDVEIRSTELEVEVIKSADPFPSPLEESLTWDIYSSYVLLQPPEDLVAEVETEEGKDVTETMTDDPLAYYTIDDVKSVLGQVTGEMLKSLQSEINEKLQKQEEAYSARISKLIKQ